MRPTEPSITVSDALVRRTVELAEIPAPTGLEDARRGQEHTPGEWIGTPQLGTGLRCAVDTITSWELDAAGERGGHGRTVSRDQC